MASKEQIKDFVSKLKKNNPDLNTDIEKAWNAARGGNRKGFYLSILRIARTGEKVGELDSIINEG